MLQGQPGISSPANKFLLREGECVVNDYIYLVPGESPHVYIACLSFLVGYYTVQEMYIMTVEEGRGGG